MANHVNDSHLGEHLVRTGKLSHADLLSCLEEQQRLGGPLEKPLSEILLEKGYISPVLLQQLESMPKVPVPSEEIRAAGMKTPRSYDEPLPEEVREAMEDPTRRIGHYVVLSVLGQGGMGVVYQGYDLHLQREVAIKTVLTASASQGEGRARFLREARACAKLRHPGIVAIHEVGEHEGRPYLVMEMVNGQLLSDVLDSRTASARDLARVLHGLAMALDHAHAAGIIHRDIKPANVILNAEDQPLLMDFGIAHDASAQQQLTETGQLLGTPLYMAPEQVKGQGRDLGPWTDIYALGVILYQGLTGQPPFKGNNAVSLFREILMDNPEPLRSLDATIHPDLEIITLKCLEKKPQHRYPSAATVAQDLQSFLDGQAILALPPSLWRRLERAARPWLSLLVPAVVLLAGLIGWGAWVLTRPGTLRVSVKPSHAQVFVDDRRVELGDVSLKPGFHRVRAEATGHVQAERLVELNRGETLTENFSLELESGFLEVRAVPAGATLWINERPYGTPLRDQRLVIGSYDVLATMPDHYRQRFQVTIKPGEVTQETVYLPRALAWHRGIPDWYKHRLIGDVDGDGYPDIGTMYHDSILIVFSGRTGGKLMEQPLCGRSKAHYTWCDVNGDGVEDVVGLFVEDGQAFTAAFSPKDEGEWLWKLPNPYSMWVKHPKVLHGPSQDGRPRLLLTVPEGLAVCHADNGSPVWTLSTPPNSEAFLIPAGNGQKEILVASSDRFVRYDLHTGQQLEARNVDGFPTGIGWNRGAKDDSNGWLARLHETTLEMWHLTTGKRLELCELDPEDALWLIKDLNGDGTPEALVRGPSEDGGSELKGWDMSGTLLWRHSLMGQPRWGTGSDEALQEGYLLFAHGDSVLKLDASTGEVVWKTTLPAQVSTDLAACDYDGDGTTELFIGTRHHDVGDVVALDQDGREIFSTRTTKSPSSSLLFFDGNGDGLQDVLLMADGPALVYSHNDRVLWRRQSATAHRPGAALHDVNKDERPDVIVPIRRGSGRTVACYDGRDGSIIWEVDQQHDYLNAPAVADIMGEGRSEVILPVGAGSYDGRQVIRCLDPATGRKTRDLVVDARKRPIYADLSTGDLDGDGIQEVVACLWTNLSKPDGRGQVAVLSAKKQGEHQTLQKWDIPGTSWRGAQLADPGDNDGKLAIFVATSSGHVLRYDLGEVQPTWVGSTGKDENRGGLTIAPGDPPLVLVTSLNGNLYAFEADDGEEVFNKHGRGLGGGGTESRPAVWPRDEPTHIVTGTRNGVVCFDIEGNLQWRTAHKELFGSPVLIEKLSQYGRPIVIVASSQGVLHCLDLEDGESLWRYATGQIIEGTPAIADINNDGFLDVVVTSHDCTITALSGK